MCMESDNNNTNAGEGGHKRPVHMVVHLHAVDTCTESFSIDGEVHVQVAEFTRAWTSL